MEFPTTDQIAEAIKHLLVARGNKPLAAQEAYRLLAEHFRLDHAHFNATASTRRENRWAYLVRGARKGLVEKGVLYPPPPKDCWRLTEPAHKGLTSSLEELGL